MQEYLICIRPMTYVLFSSVRLVDEIAGTLSLGEIVMEMDKAKALFL
jgi:hypothetical protein